MRLGIRLSFVRSARRAEIADISVIFVSSFLLSLVLYLVSLRNILPYPIVKRYARSLCAGDYKSAVLLFDGAPGGLCGGSDAVADALKGRYGGVGGMDIVSLDTTRNDACTVLFDIEKNGRHFEDTAAAVDIDREGGIFDRDWRIAFPFIVQDLKISGIDGSEVFIDGRKAGQIRNGMLNIGNIISSRHDFYSVLEHIGESEHINIELGKNTSEIDLRIHPGSELAGTIKKLLSDFCGGWSKYCMNQDISFIRPYLTDSVFEMYKNDAQIFAGSRYLFCDGSVRIEGLDIIDGTRLLCTAYEEWHTKEVITDRRMVFSQNKKNELERLQRIKWGYGIIYQGGIWRIASIDSIEFSQDIMK